MISANGMFDLQVNGYAGVDFNALGQSPDTVAAMCQRLRDEGVAGILATVITDNLEAMSVKLAQICQLREQDTIIAELVWGVHIEGPFLNTQDGYIGAHPKSAAVPATPDAMERLLDAASGLTKIVTLAPECDASFAVTHMLADRNIVVSAGHCDPTTDQLKGCIDAGLSMFTHLGNGCPLNMHRHDNIIQRVLAFADKLWIGFIADGVHVPFVALNNYIRCAGIDHCFVVTDAISAAGLGPGVYQLGDQQVVVDESLATWSADKSHLFGSAGTMPRTVANLVSLGYAPDEISKLTDQNPRKAVGLSFH